MNFIRTRVSGRHFYACRKSLYVMKITTLILLVSVMSVSASTLAQKITLKEKHASLEQVLEKIRVQSGYDFIYSDKMLEGAAPVTIRLKDASLTDALQACLQGQPLSFDIEEGTVVLHARPAPAKVTPVSVEIHGTVTDSKGTTLPGVSVLLKGTTIGTVTDINGRFNLKIPNASGTLVFSFVGLAPKEVKITSAADITVVLADANSTLNEVVVTGYSSQSRATVTSSISKLDTRVLDNIPYTNVATAMQGAVAGVRVQTTSGQPGATPRVIVRGGTSINSPNSANPLYIVDGVVRDLEDLSADDIESLQVLKDAAATSIYGARGSNGVVLVKTKSAKAGVTKVSYSYDGTTSSTLNRYKFVSGEEYITATRLGMLNAGKTPAQEASLLSEPRSYGVGNDLTKNTQWTPQILSAANAYKTNDGWQTMPDPVDPSKTILYKNTDFQSKVYQPAFSQNHYISVSGGSDKARMMAGLGYMRAQGTVRTTDYKRLTLSMNGDIKVKDNLSIFARVSYSGAGDNHTQAINNYVVEKYTALPQIAKYAYEDGSLATARNETLGNPDYYFPLFDLDGDELQKEKLTASVGGHWDILPGLSFDPQLSIYNQERRTNSFLPQFTQGVAVNSTRNATAQQGEFRQKQVDAMFNYRKQFGNSHNVSAVVGFAYLGRDTTTLTAAGRGAATDNITTLNASSVPVSVGSTLSRRIIASYLYGVNYDFKQKYLLTLNGRYDGASNLGDDHKWGFFPGVSAGWNINEEDFWKNSSFLGDKYRAKLRVSYGVNGNLGPLSDYQAQGAYSAGIVYNGSSAIYNTLLPNPDLRWEQSKTFDVGTDIGLFNGRINFLFDVYRRVTDNLLTQLTLPPSTGFSTILTNYGSLEGRGIEFELNAKVLSPKSPLQWDLSFNAARVKNKIIKLPFAGVDRNRVGGVFIYDPKRGVYDWFGGLQEGFAIGDMFAYKQAGIYATDAEAAAGPTDAVNTIKKFGGDVKWQDTDGNGIIEDKDRVYVGNPYPVWTGGFSNYFTYKNFNLAIRMDYATGHTSQNSLIQQFNQNAIGDVNMTKSFYDASWKKQGDITNVPRYETFDPKSNLGRGNSTYFQKADYLALREVTLAYDLPKKFMQRIKMSALRLSITGSNLYYFTAGDKYGLYLNNPEEGGQALGQYALSRNFTFSAKVTF